MEKVTQKIEKPVHIRFKTWAARYKNYSVALERLLNIAKKHKES